MISPLFRKADSFLKINTLSVEAKVFLDGKEIGTTPYSGRSLRSGEYNLRLAASLKKPTGKEVEFSTLITLTSRALTAVNYEFGPNKTFSSGDTRTLIKGEGLSIITQPSGADVWLDGEKIGNKNSGISRYLVSGPFS